MIVCLCTHGISGAIFILDSENQSLHMTGVSKRYALAYFHKALASIPSTPEGGEGGGSQEHLATSSVFPFPTPALRA